MKLLFLSQGVEISDHPGWENALLRLKQEGLLTDYLNLPYFGYVKRNSWQAFYEHIVDICRREHFDVVYFHYFHHKGALSPAQCVARLREIKNGPVIVTSVGDGFSDNWMMIDYPENFKIMSSLADMTFSTQMGKAAAKMESWGAKNIVYVANSMCQVRFNARKIDLAKHSFDFDVVLIGSNNGNRLFNPISKHWWGAKERQKLVNALYKRFGKKFGLFGHGWDLPCAQGPVNFSDQQSTFQKGRIIVGGNPYSYSDYYSSNRIFFEISSGVPAVELAVPRLDGILRNNEHCYFANSVKELVGVCDRLLNEEPEDLYNKASKAAMYIDEKHTQYHRMKFKIDTIQRYIKNNRRLDVNFPFFLPEVNLEKEKQFALRAII